MDDPRRARDRLRSEINIAPMVDVCLVLLIIFIVVTPLLGNRSEVELPKGRDPKSEAENPAQVRISLRFGSPPTILIGESKTPLSLHAFAARMKELYADAPHSQLMLRADRRLPYLEAKKLLAYMSEAGFKDAGLIAERETSLR